MKLFLVGSPWHAQIALSLSDGDSVFVIEKTSAKSESTINAILRGRHIVAVFDWDDTNFSKKFLNVLINPYFFNIAIRKIRSVAKVFNCSSLYVFNMDSVISRVFVYNTRYAELVKVEDGICDYLPFKFYTEAGLIKKFLKSVYTKIFCINKYFNPNIETLYSYGLFFFPDNANFDFKCLPLSIVYAKLREQLSAEAIYMSNEEAAGALIIGQSLFEDRNCTLESEIELYSKTVRDLIEFKGVKSVTFKPHPRSSPDKIELLKKIGPEINIKYDDVTVESLIAAAKFSYVIGVWSNPVFHSKELFGVQCFSLLPYLVENKRTFDISDKLIETHFCLLTSLSEYYTPYVFGERIE